MTLAEIFNKLGIGNTEVTIKAQENNSSGNEPQTEPTTEQQTTDSSTAEQQTTQSNPEIEELKKQIEELKATNQRLLTQTPVEHTQTADEALLELLGIQRGDNNGNETDTSTIG